MRVVVCWLNGVVPVFDGNLAIDENRNGEKFFATPARRTSQNGGLARVSGSNGDFSSIVIASK
jgi:hypothetical protein